jgi:cyclase
MRRRASLAVVTLVALGLTGATYEARQPRAEIHGIQKVGDDLYLLSNPPPPAPQTMLTGGNTVAFVTTFGVVLVDTKLEGYGQDILDLVATVTDKPVTTIINTHTHYDHSGSNTEFPDTVEFVAHENTRAQMAQATCTPVANCDAFKGDNAKYLPSTTFSGRKSLFDGDDRIDLYHFGRGHTDGDTFVVFPNARTVHTGDMFQRLGLPFIDVVNGNGSAVDFGSTLMRAVDGLKNVDTVIAGHHTVTVPWSTFVNFSGFFNDLVWKALQGIASGQTVEQVAGAYVKPDAYSDFQAPAPGVTTLVQHIYNESQ